VGTQDVCRAIAVLNVQAWLDHFRQRFGVFAVLSGIGFLLDFATYTTLAQLHLRLFGANLAGAAVGMGTVFIGSRLAVFSDAKASLPLATGLYAIWSIVAVLFASVLIDAVGALLHGPAVISLLTTGLGLLPLPLPVNLAISTSAKIVVTPLTIILNFCAMTVINGPRTRLQPLPFGKDQDSDLCADVQLRKADRAGDQPM
jgi:putative flippase GtrA